MLQNKLFSMALILLIAITLLGTATFVLWQTYIKPAAVEGSAAAEEKPKTIDEILELTVSTEEIVTNLYTGDFIQVQFNLQADSKHAKEELEKRMYQVQSVIIKTLSSMTPDDVNGAEGLNTMETNIIQELNGILQNGRVVKVYTTKKMIQF